MKRADRAELVVSWPRKDQGEESPCIIVCWNVRLRRGSWGWWDKLKSRSVPDEDQLEDVLEISAPQYSS